MSEIKDSSDKEATVGKGSNPKPVQSRYSVIAENPESTVIAEFHQAAKRDKDYQNEAALESEFISILQSQGYEYLEVFEGKDLEQNLRGQLDKLNNYKFSDDEWERFFGAHLANDNDSIADKTRTIQEDYIKNLTTDQGETRNIKLIDKKQINNNSLQVINQYVLGRGYVDRYDVTILVNGLPLVHIELKRRGVPIKEAFNQINRYQRESFWAGWGLYKFVQIFVISNGTQTKYYSNTTHDRFIKEFSGSAKSNKKMTSHNFVFTSWWADANNKPIYDLTDFARTFFAKRTLLNILTKYCVFDTDETLLVMRPYQIVATERILNRILCSANAKTTGKLEAGGYIWHTTGSGKTLTSFKTAQLATAIDGVDIDKVLFVVDRKDLDYQTMKEYNKFAEGAVNSNVSTQILTEQLTKRNGALLESGKPNQPIVVTTIQKLSQFIKSNPGHDIYKKHVVIIFDECHRSQFGAMHKAITKAFAKYHMFGFTGTPIFASNAAVSGSPRLQTTEQAFGDQLHAYTVVDAIQDKNVLPFLVQFYNTVAMRRDIEDKKGSDPDVERALIAPERISAIVSYILANFDKKTYRNQNKSYYYTRVVTNIDEVARGRMVAVAETKKTRELNGFNAIFATASIEAAKSYYAEFKNQQQNVPEAKRLKIGIIFSSDVNESLDDWGAGGLKDENNEDPETLDESDKSFLRGAILDYNAMFHTNYDISADKFQNYYRDISMRVKNRELDLLIVVNMFLTGFDATTLNTLWVDKKLHHHGLLQAFSRTNRILNSVKVFGNIVCFRPLEQEINEALTLFGDRETSGIVLMKKYEDYYNEYAQKISELVREFPLGEPIIGEAAQRKFVHDYNAILRLKNILFAFDEFEGNEILSLREFQDFQSMYLTIYDEKRPRGEVDRENINDDIVFEIELIKQIEINVDYILMLIRKYHEGDKQDNQVYMSIEKAVASSPGLRNKGDLIKEFIRSLTVLSQVDQDWELFMTEKRNAELDSIIKKERLKPEETYQFIDNAFRDGQIQRLGMDITKILPPVSKFDGTNAYDDKKRIVLAKLDGFFERFFGIV